MSWLNGSLVLLVAAMPVAAAAAAQDCPAKLPDAPAHALVRASVFDGPPEQMADLVPDPVTPTALWDLAGVDAYLVCRYKGTEQTVVFHVQGAKACEAGGKPFHAGCR